VIALDAFFVTDFFLGLATDFLVGLAADFLVGFFATGFFFADFVGDFAGFLGAAFFLVTGLVTRLLVAFVALPPTALVVALLLAGVAALLLATFLAGALADLLFGAALGVALAFVFVSTLALALEAVFVSAFAGALGVLLSVVLDDLVFVAFAVALVFASVTLAGWSSWDSAGVALRDFRFGRRDFASGVISVRIDRIRGENGDARNSVPSWCASEANSTPLALGIARSAPGTTPRLRSFSSITPRTNMT